MRHPHHPRHRPPRRPLRAALAVLALLVVLALAALAGCLWWTLPAREAGLSLPGLSAPVEVALDAQGIPRIAARNDEGRRVRRPGAAIFRHQMPG